MFVVPRKMASAHAAIVNHILIANSLRVVNLPRALFLVRRGSLGKVEVEEEIRRREDKGALSTEHVPGLCLLCTVVSKFRTPQTGRLLNRTFGPSRKVFPSKLGCLHRHGLGGLVKTSVTVARFDSAIRTDLDSLLPTSLVCKSGNS